MMQAQLKRFHIPSKKALRLQEKIIPHLINPSEIYLPYGKNLILFYSNKLVLGFTLTAVAAVVEAVLSPAVIMML